MKMPKRKCEQDIGFRSGKRQEVGLSVPSGEPDIEGLRSLTRDWLMPRLVEKFLRLHGAELRSSSQALPINDNRLTTPISKCDAAARLHRGGSGKPKCQ
jgi:hypothetical protein